MFRITLFFAALLLSVDHAAAVSKLQGAVKARMEKDYAVVVFADGAKKIIPLPSLTPAELAALTDLSNHSPFPAGKSKVTFVKEEDMVKAKQTIQVSKTEAGMETVQLCPPNVFRNQIGSTCMMYARVHWLDIAGYYAKNESIYKIINAAPSDSPWKDPRYIAGLTTIMIGFKPKPVVHNLPPQADPFEWARQELRKGHPILAAFPREIWQALPSGFIAAHPWNGGPIGHQIVINGFTWNNATHSGTFHIINSWEELPEFDLKLEAAKGGNLVIQQSLSPIGEAKSEEAKEIVQSITFIKTVGTTNLYEVKTNLGMHRVAAPNEEVARASVDDHSDQ